MSSIHEDYYCKCKEVEKLKEEIKSLEWKVNEEKERKEYFIDKTERIYGKYNGLLRKYNDLESKYEQASRVIASYENDENITAEWLQDIFKKAIIETEEYFSKED